MPAVADIQNTIIREFADEPRVVTAVLNQGDPQDVLETFWRNVYLRGQMLFDPNKTVGPLYSQPDTGLPFSEGWVIGPDQVVVLPIFGHRPETVISAIYDQLDGMPPLDSDGDGVGDDIDNCVLYNPNQADCQPNGIGDVCDIADETSEDCDVSGVPDECDRAQYGDVDGDAEVDADDLICMLDGLSAYWDTPGVTYDDLDLFPCTGDGELNLRDLLGLLDALAGQPACPAPCS